MFANFDYSDRMKDIFISSGIDPHAPIDGRDCDLSEDLLQVTCEHDYLLDAGWYGDGCNGVFRVFVIKGTDWQTPVLLRAPNKTSSLASAQIARKRARRRTKTG